MKVTTGYRSLALCLALLPAACSTAKKEAPEARAMAKREQPVFTPQQMEEAMKKAATPTDYHRALDTLVGKWNVTTKMWMDPSQEPEVTTGKAEFRWVLDGHYLEQTFTGTFMGKPFQGTGILAYNNLGEKYQSTWTDSMSTQVMVSEGTLDADKQGITFSGTADCPFAPDGKMTATSKLSLADKNQHVFTMYNPGPDGQETKGMEITYTRAHAKVKTKTAAKATK